MLFKRWWGLWLLVLLLAACAPENLDITPSPTPTLTPEPTNTPMPTDANAAAVVPTEVAVETNSIRGTLDAFIATIPAAINAGQTTWNKTEDEVTSEEITYQDQEGGITAKVYYDERGGGYSELTFGLFDTPEAALAFYEVVAERTRTLENAETRDQFVTPNLFGGGTYGSDAIFVQGSLYIRISVPRFSSTLGDPLNPYARTLFRLFETLEVPGQE
jgi:hypothetical protein